MIRKEKVVWGVVILPTFVQCVQRSARFCDTSVYELKINKQTKKHEEERRQYLSVKMKKKT